MKLEEKFINSFFYMFLIGVIINLIIAIGFLYFFTNNYIEKKTGQNIVDLEKKICKNKSQFCKCLIINYLIKSSGKS